MVDAGQLVNTKYGTGSVISRGAVAPEVFVRIHSNSQIYVLKSCEVSQMDSRADRDAFDEGVETRANLSGSNAIPLSVGNVTDPSTSLGRGQMKKRRVVHDTPLAVFVTDRLADLGMKQSEFCRLTGFDQGLLSKIQSSMISKLNLETALRLAAGLSVSPKTIFELIGRQDLHPLVVAAYSNETREAVLNQDVPDVINEMTRLASRALEFGQDLTPVVDHLTRLVSTQENTRFRTAGDPRGDDDF